MLTFDTNGNIYIFSEEDGEKPKKKGFFKKHWKKLLAGAGAVALGTAAYLNKDKLGEGFNKAKEFVGNKIQALKDRKGPAPEDKVAPESPEDIVREARQRGSDSSREINNILGSQEASARKKAQRLLTSKTASDYDKAKAQIDYKDAQKLRDGDVTGAGYTATYDYQKGAFVDANGNIIKDAIGKPTTDHISDDAYYKSRIGVDPASKATRIARLEDEYRRQRLGPKADLISRPR